MTLPQIVSLISTSLLTVVAVIIGIQLMLILKEIRYTLGKVNQTLDTAESTLQKISQPAVGLFAIIEGLKQSGKIVETLSSFMGHRKNTPPVQVDSYESDSL
ncbi:MAG TPA: hypothetical protein VF837_05595 [Patescibacteria group bacterium]